MMITKKRYAGCWASKNDDKEIIQIIMGNDTVLQDITERGEKNPLELLVRGVRTN
jgi:hypothetical protein